MRVPDEILKCVVFVGRVLPGVIDLRPRATAFIVAVPLEQDPSNSVVYLVTARHTAEELSLGPWFIRVNMNDGSCREVVNPRPEKWFFHPSEPESVDAAVSIIMGTIDECDVANVPLAMFATPPAIAKCNIGVGDEVFFPTLFTKMTGRHRNFPILRDGKIALMPSEKVPGIKIGQAKSCDADAYLIEARSVGGISGAPVFVRETVNLSVVTTDGRQMQVPLSGSYLLLGLMHGHWDVDETQINEPFIRSVTREERLGVNVGIAVVVPAQKIHDILMTDEMIRHRQKVYQDRIDAQGTTSQD